MAEVESDDEEGDGIVKKIVMGEVDGVLCCEEYPSCISCRAKIKCVNEVVGECMKCGMVSKMKRCKMVSMAKVVVGGQDDKSYVVTTEVLLQITDGIDGDGMAMKLLSAPPHTCLIASRDVVYSVQKLCLGHIMYHRVVIDIGVIMLFWLAYTTRRMQGIVGLA